jgi:hypothetical protein
MIHYVSNFKPIENEQIDLTLNLGLYILQVWSPQIEKNNLLSLSFLSSLIALINNNRWNISYLFPSKNIKQLNLYGLTIEAKQLTGIKGWNPSIQAYAKDLYESNHHSEQPKNLELFLISWEQPIRISESIFKENDYKEKEIIITEKIK